MRAALGAPSASRWSGISYGTYYALRYARAHPDRVERLILDSVVPQENVGLDLPATWPAIRGLLAHALRVTRAAARSRRPARRPRRRPLERLRQGPLAAPVNDGRGRSRVGASPSPALYDLLLATCSTTSCGRAAALLDLAAAAAGDAAPLVRASVAQRSRRWWFPASYASWAVHAATLCADLPPPAYGLLAADLAAPFTPEAAAANGLHDTVRALARLDAPRRRRRPVRCPTCRRCC